VTKNVSIKFCKKCLYSENHPLGITFNDEGICSGCLVHDEKNKLDWSFRWQKLLKLVKRYKSKKNNYDAIVPVSGAQDSYFIMYIVKKLGLKPLVVHYNKYFNTDVGIYNLSNLRIKFNTDIIFQNVNPRCVKKLTKKTFTEFGNIYWPILAGNSVFPVQISIKYKIPLIIWGAHQGLEQVGMYSHKNEVEMTRRYRKNHDLFGIDEYNIFNTYDDLNQEDLSSYFYPSDSELKHIGTRGIYLGNYLRWDPKAQHEKMIKLFNYKTTRFNRTIDCYDYVDCFNYLNLHDYLKFLKHGYSKITDHLTREIRHKRIDKISALKIVSRYEKKSPLYVGLFSEWMGIDSKGLKFITDKFKNNNLIYHNKSFQSLNDIAMLENKKKLKRKQIKKISFFNNSSIKKKNYITFGKGY
tara:strand:+ start:4932 stop:6161 length:1230 start_codon:yes stop_codon:yes gene_type:complete